MKRPLIYFFSVLVIVLSFCPALAGQTEQETVYFAVEMQGTLVGYMEIVIEPGIPDRTPTIERMTMVLMLKVLGQDFDVKVDGVSRINPATGKTFRVETDITRGDQSDLGSTFVFDGNDVHITPDAGGERRTVRLDDDVLLEDSLRYDYVLKDLGRGDAGSKTYRLFEFMTGEVHDKTFTAEGEETLLLAGRDFDCVVYSQMDKTLGLRSKIWVDKSTARAVRTETANGFSSYLADRNVKVMTVRGDMDSQIFADVDVSIADFQAISYMKVRAKIQSVGAWITAESLSVPGQSFEGTVEDNLIEGVFEIEHKKYDGRNAPPFPPPDFGEDETLGEYLEPEDLVESNDPVLIAKARELTAGARNAWEAAVRLSRWVSEEIVYEIPGGSARHVFDTRKGECGSHARLLTAFCRGVGIPARAVGGGMYVPMRGGSFGQHAWTEIYMGDAGWITVDATVQEIDFVDSGHIRLGVNAGFNPREMEVLDYRAGALEMGKEGARLVSLSHVPYEIGKQYTFTYTVRGEQIGTEILTVKSFDQTISGGVYHCECRVKFPPELTALIEFKLDQYGFPLDFGLDANASGGEVTIDCEFSAGQVKETLVQGGTPVERTVDLSGDVYLISNNNVSLLAFLALIAPREAGAVCAFTAFHPPSMQTFPAQVTTRGKETIAWHGEDIECWLLEYSLAGTPIKIWVDETGRLIREEEQGGLVTTELSTDS